MLKRYPSIQSMQAFLQAARVGSFSSAARQLALTHSAISQQIRSLEEFIGQPLFVRTGGRVSLTDAGTLLANQLSDGLEQIDRALSSVKGRASVPSLRLDVDPELMQGWLPARMPALMRALGGTTLAVLTAPRHDRDAFDRVDVALRYGYGEWEGVDSALVCPDRLTAMASPALLERYGLRAPLAPAGVLTLPLLGYTKRSWIPWLEAAGLAPVEPDTIAVFDNAAGLVAALASGLGAGLARGLLAADARRDGRLVELCTIAIPTHYNLHAIWPRERHARVKPLLDAIGALVAQTLAR
ncbi:LysR family transcriptional regulator [Burkholderia multivorans]|uniref:LysR family transcriptional regulator n=1 Tax=Burkholderia multivorans TaxID=87883 RepID=A0ABD7L806_9BURK|nr:LysR substrate-binding domain-containing protein [Burkholderia multivorans]SAJ93511.1 LysR family transcriptional regulator [Burkholderia multivorans]SAJ98830.1 LysR family transcriptional regulator [Burkholderia multivorans]HEF5153700.1 LysR family transcriptional regulator [Burkholderia multivorans]